LKTGATRKRTTINHAERATSKLARPANETQSPLLTLRANSIIIIDDIATVAAAAAEHDDCE